MYITRDGAFEDFAWYSGVSNLTATEGTWNLKSNPSDPTPLIDIDWSRSATSEIAEIRYTNVIPGDDGNGSYLEFGITDDPDYDAFYGIFNIENGNTREIQWNRETKARRIKDPAHYDDEDFHCWDQELMDTDC